MKPKVKEINLLPKEYVQAQKIKTYVLMGIVALFLECILFVVIVVLPPRAELKAQQNSLIKLEEQVNDPKFSEVNKTIEDLNITKEAVQKWIDKYKALKKPNFVSGELFDELVARLPQGVTIDNVEVKAIAQAEGEAQVERPSIVIKGRTQTTNQLLNYIAIMETIYKSAAVTFNIEEGTAESAYQKYDVTIKMPLPPAPKVEETPAETLTETPTEAPEGGTES